VLSLLSECRGAGDLGPKHLLLCMFDAVAMCLAWQVSDSSVGFLTSMAASRYVAKMMLYAAAHHSHVCMCSLSNCSEWDTGF
jgi:hypothetical protein